MVLSKVSGWESVVSRAAIPGALMVTIRFLPRRLLKPKNSKFNTEKFIIYHKSTHTLYGWFTKQYESILEDTENTEGKNRFAILDQYPQCLLISPGQLQS